LLPLNTNLATPSLTRRLASMSYESLLVFAILLISNLLFSVLLEQKHALYLRHLLQGWLFLVTCAYFVWFWTHGGQTLPMKTWRLHLVTSDGANVDMKRAIGRCLLCWLWVLPGLGIASALPSQHWSQALAPVALNILLGALTIYLDPQRQFFHDRIIGTRIVDASPSPTSAKPVK
jgi:uncharacterized RDD family membrane protein YckC